MASAVHLSVFPFAEVRARGVKTGHSAALVASDNAPRMIQVWDEEVPTVMSARQRLPASAIPQPTPLNTTPPRPGLPLAASCSRHHDDTCTSAHALAMPATVRQRIHTAMPCVTPIAN